MDKPIEKSDFLTTREAARRLGVALSTVQGWVEAGALKAWKTPGGHRRIPASAIDSMRTEQLDILEKGHPHDGNLTVLVVEDEVAQQEIYRLQLKKLDLPITLHVAENGYQGLVMYGRHEPDLIIADLVMPEMDGFRMIQELLSLGNSAESIIVVSSLSKEEIKAKGGLPEGIRAFSKPLKLKDLKNVLKKRTGQMASGS
jgi:excisionase family DNA binding protein